MRHVCNQLLKKKIYIFANGPSTLRGKSIKYLFHDNILSHTYSVASGLSIGFAVHQNDEGKELPPNASAGKSRFVA